MGRRSRENPRSGADLCELTLLVQTTRKEKKSPHIPDQPDGILEGWTDVVALFYLSPLFCRIRTISLISTDNANIVTPPVE
jgi:hypothetical protein